MDADGLDGPGFLQKLQNLYRLQGQVDDLVRTATKPGASFVFSEDLLKSLHRTCMINLFDEAGQYRRVEVSIRGSNHIPPAWIDVPAYMTTLPSYINENWNRRDLVHLASFCLWRMNWIHPFRNGNGRVARAASYLILCMKHGALLPAKNTVIQQVQSSRAAYFDVLGQADRVFAATNSIDAAVAPVEHLMTRFLTKQIQEALGEG